MAAPVPLPQERPKEQRQRGAGSQQTVPPAVTWSPSHPSHRGPQATSQLINYSPHASQTPKSSFFFSPCNILVFSSGSSLSPCGTDTELLDDPNRMIHCSPMTFNIPWDLKPLMLILFTKERRKRQTPALGYGKKQFLSVLCLPPQLKILGLCILLEH